MRRPSGAEYLGSHGLAAIPSPLKQRDRDDDEEISRIYLQHSTKCAEAAVARAKDDEKEALEILKTIMPPKRKSSLGKPKRTASMGSGKAPRRGASEGIDKARVLLRERSSLSRSEIRDDIKKLEKKQNARQCPGIDRTVSL